MFLSPAEIETVGVTMIGATGIMEVSWMTGASGLCLPAEIKRTRQRRLDRIKTVTLSGFMRLEERASRSELHDLDLSPRPQTWAECKDMPRPCPYVSCKHHLYIEVNPDTGAVRLPFGHLEIDEIPHTCSIDAALEGPLTLQEVGKLTSRTKERIRQIETQGLAKVLRAGISPSMLNPGMADWMDF
jgi:hypothetical protein